MHCTLIQQAYATHSPAGSFLAWALIPERHILGSIGMLAMLAEGNCEESDDFSYKANALKDRSAGLFHSVS